MRSYTCKLADYYPTLDEATRGFGRLPIMRWRRISHRVSFDLFGF